MEVQEVLTELQESERDENLQIFRKLITSSRVPCYRLEKKMPAERDSWQPVLMKLLKILVTNRDCGKEKILLVPHAFLSLLHEQCELYEFEIILKSYLQLDNNSLNFFGTVYHIRDLDLFKLIILHGYTQVNRKEIYTEEICAISFEILYENCIRYKKYTYLAYKVLQNWLRRTSEINFWERNSPEIEKKLESLIFSNWDNSIKEVSKQNSTSVFNKYLRIMDSKYERFLYLMFQDCLDNMSWLNETKYVILTEICDVWDNVKMMTEKNFILPIFTCLEKNYLRTSGTKLYNTISNKLSDEQWKDTFGYAIARVILQWGNSSRRNDQALQLLCTQWLEPVVKKRRSILPFLWELSDEVPDVLFRSHLERITSQSGVRGVLTVETFIDHCDEYLRINSFATHCQKHIYFENDDLTKHFSIVRHFLFHNANSSSTFLRRGIIKYFRIFFLNLLKSCSAQNYYNQDVFSVFDWLNKFFIDSFEVGSCYQRKILGIKLYEIVLFYTNERVMSNEIRTDSRYKEDFTNGFKMNKELEDFGEWMFTSRTNLIWLFKLTLDPATDVRDISTEIILEHFQSSALNDSEKMVLLNTAIAKCNSSKFYETESGSTLFKILSNWLPLREVNRIKKEEEHMSKESLRFYRSLKIHKKYIEYLMEEAHNQLVNVKKDILRAAIKNSPFHGTLTTILNVGFRNESDTEFITPEFAENLLQLLEDAVNFFLSLLSSKSSNRELSSSFSEMGLAIDESVKDSELSDNYDDVVLSPAHQIVITCIWISLKVSCELASEIGMLTYSYEMVERSANLISSVLMKCRYKGAIEAAGVAISHLTGKLVKVEGYSNLPEEWLVNLISDHKINPNLTRRGAGLSIMFHRIVANDKRHGKPLVHIAIKNLLNLLKNEKDFCEFEEDKTSSLSTEEKNESYQDLPRVKHLNFIQRLVADSDLHAQVVPYLDRIATECFKNLQSQIWTVRNASLQLFGAVAPRIAGQCNGDEALDFGNGYSVDHFVTHYPELANYIFLELRTAVSWDNHLADTLITHSALVPSMTLLCRMSTGGSDFIDYSSRSYIIKIKEYLELLFGSPIGNVRILAAKAYAALVAFPQINFECEKLKLAVRNVEQTNYAHGYACAVKYLSEKLKVENENARLYNANLTTWDDNVHLLTNCTVGSIKDPQASRSNQRGVENVSESTSGVTRVEKFWNNLYRNEFKSNLCYVTEAMRLLAFEDSRNCPDIYLFKEIGEEIDAVLESEKNKPGFGEFVDISTRFYAENINLTNNFDEEIIKKILNSQCTDQAVTLINNLAHSAPLQDIVLNYILQVFPDCKEALLTAAIRYLNQSVKKIPILFNLEIEMREKVHRLVQKIGENRKYWKLEQLFYILINTVEFNGKFMDSIVDYCCRRALDDDEMTRKLAAECLPCLFLNFFRTENNNKLKILKLCLTFLKDEVSEIRELTIASLVEFLKINSTEYAASPFDEILYFYIFNEILTNKTSYANFTKIEIVEFFVDCIDSINCTKGSKALVESPFDHEDDATSAEEIKLLNIIFFSLLHLENNRSFRNNFKLGEITIRTDCSGVIEANNKLYDKIIVDISDLKTILDLSFVDYVEIKVKFIRELCNSILELANHVSESREGGREVGS